MNVGGGLQQGFPLRAALRLQIPGDQQPCLAPHGAELLAGLWLGEFGGSYRRKAGRHSGGTLGRGLTWLRGSWSTGGRFAVLAMEAGVGVEALAKFRASLGAGALGRDWRLAAGNT